MTIYAQLDLYDGTDMKETSAMSRQLRVGCLDRS
ncbi:hypothetical protein DEU29_11716 [Idiomarina aquatica]|uniref:Uncharacterized protein n=1 Tax=Idiomarina aquatica TaxID=1327752 RepID=A0A4R6NYU7_9GAMM|nr:hypothetical protein DEU29_11716 [Idiomarina aquatica]